MVLGVMAVAEFAGVIDAGMRGGAADVPNAQPARARISAPFQPTKCPLCGTVESIRAVELRGAPEDTQSAPVNEVAARRERDTTTILGTVRGAFTGWEAEAGAKKRVAYRVIVRMDDGSYRTVSQSTPPTLAIGDKVRVVEGRLVRT